jgi:hypothetical protein
MADQHITEFPPLQEHSRQPQPTNKTVNNIIHTITSPSRRSTIVHHILQKSNHVQPKDTQIKTRGNYKRRKGNCISVSSRILKHNLYTWRWPDRPKHVVPNKGIRKNCERCCIQTAQKLQSQFQVHIQTQNKTHFILHLFLLKSNFVWSFIFWQWTHQSIF